jgi:signal transduction histidine kinase
LGLGCIYERMSAQPAAAPSPLVEEDRVAESRGATWDQDGDQDRHRDHLRARPGGTHTHRVQFYDDETFLYGVVADFLGEGLSAGESAVVIATEAHRTAFCEQLAARGHDVAEARRSGQLTLLDAATALTMFMVDGEPDWDRFRSSVGKVVDDIAGRQPGKSIRAYGEMVDLLWRAGNQQAAIQLEELWNDLGQLHRFDLLCAYVMSNFHQHEHATGFDRICGSHSHVTPSESWGQIPGPDSLRRRVSSLEQKARALESEIARRQQLEESLRDALAERERIAEALRTSETQLRSQNRELTRTVRFSETFVGILGHDLRNPLSGITTAASLLMRRAETDRQLAPAQRILSSGQRMARMIDQLLDFTRIRLGQGLPLEQRAVDLGDICRLALAELEGPDGDGQAAGAPPPRTTITAAGDLVGHWDADRLCQLVGNLVGNALTHGPAGTPIRLSLDGRDEASVSLEVHNSGVIPVEVLRVIFEPFRGAEDRKQARSSGLGLGLYISQQIVLCHDGRIEVTSAEDKGTRFIICLPRKPGRAEPAFTS